MIQGCHEAARSPGLTRKGGGQLCRERANKKRLRLTRALEKAPSGTADAAPASVGRYTPTRPDRVFQSEYADEAWGYSTGAGHRLIDDLTGDDGSVLIFVHGVVTDSVLEAPRAESLAAASGLKAYLSFESRDSRWLGLSSLSARYDSPFGLDSSAAAREACTLLQCIVDVHSRTGAPPVVVAHSRGAVVLTRAATLWEGLATAADEEPHDEFGKPSEETPGFLAIWDKLDSGTRRTLAAGRKSIRGAGIIAITGCPAVARRDPKWRSLTKWAQNRSWNLYTDSDWFLFFVGNPGFGRIPLLGHRNIRFRLRHNAFFDSSIAQRVVANLCRHGGLLRDTVDTLVHHNLGRRKLDPDTA
jgi:hypothetical protein